MSNINFEHMINELKERDLSAFNEEIPKRRSIIEWLERQNLSADAKDMLSRIIDITVQVGSTVLAVGRKLFGIVLDIVRKFPTTAFALIICAVIAALIASIPLVGGILGSFLTPLLTIFGISAGAISDLKDQSLTRRIEAAVMEFELLKAQSDGA